MIKTTAPTATSASMKRTIAIHPTATDGRSPNASENSQISALDHHSSCPRWMVAGPNLASVLLEGRKNANIHASSGVNLQNPGYNPIRSGSTGAADWQKTATFWLEVTRPD